MKIFLQYFFLFLFLFGHHVLLQVVAARCSTYRSAGWDRCGRKACFFGLRDEKMVDPPRHICPCSPYDPNLFFSKTSKWKYESTAPIHCWAIFHKNIEMEIQLLLAHRKKPA